VNRPLGVREVVGVSLTRSGWSKNLGLGIDAVTVPVPARPNCEYPTPAARLLAIRTPPLTSKTMPFRMRCTSVTVATSSYNGKLDEGGDGLSLGLCAASTLRNPDCSSSACARADRAVAAPTASTIKKIVAFFTRFFSLNPRFIFDGPSFRCGPSCRGARAR